MTEVVTVVDLLDDSPDDVLVCKDNVQKSLVAEFIWSEIKKIVNKLSKQSKHEEKPKSIKKLFNSLIMPVYKELDENYKTSKSFEKVLKNTLQLLKTNPNHKFTHIKHLYETMKLHKVRKKVNFVTIAINLSDKTYKAKKRKFDDNDNIVKKCKVDTIELDEDPPVKGKENMDCDVILLDDETDLNRQEENDSDVSSRFLNEVTDSNYIISRPDTISDSKKDSKNLLLEEKNSLLVPRNTEFFTEGSEHIDFEKKLKIENIEKKIAMFKQQIAILEEQEVDDDTITSPYIICDKYKAKIVELYGELCKLTGTDSVKRREVRLTVNDGHPPGPVRRLERFLNNRIGSDGLPPFPDFNDVVQCVIISNQIDNLGWSMPQIMREAMSLFTQCGRALQRRRQNREWRHLMDTVREQRLEVDDPAERDPALEARLQQNKRIAVKKESDLLEKYTLMQDFHPRFSQMNSKRNRALQAVCNASAGASIASKEKLQEKTAKANQNNSFGDIVIANCKTLKERNSKDVTEKSAQTVQENRFSDVKVKVKSEKVDVIEILEDLEENYKTTVKEIEDPSLVIEISSDSSSDED